MRIRYFPFRIENATLRLPLLAKVPIVKQHETVMKKVISIVAMAKRSGTRFRVTAHRKRADLSREKNMSFHFAQARTSTAMFVSLGLCWSGAPAGAEIVDQMYALAKEEKALVLWAAGSPTGYERAVRAFERQFPGITVSLTSGASNVFNAKIEQQLTNKKVDSDLVILQTIQDLIAWNKRGQLLAFKPDGFDKIDARSKDKNGGWVAVNKNPVFYGYNSERVRLIEVPILATDFLRPAFKAKLITGYPGDNDATLFAFATIVQKYGWGYMTQYMKQQPKFVESHVSVARSLASGESVVSFDATVSSTLEVQQRAGGKIMLVSPKDDLLPVSFAAEAILRDAPHPNAAKLFVTWFLSKEWQRRARVYSSRSDVPPPADLPPLSSYRLEDRYVEFLAGENQLADLRNRLKSFAGAVVGANK
jgi:ABC-type Fe3+ transport system substrate-binding protein